MEARGSFQKDEKMKNGWKRLLLAVIIVAFSYGLMVRGDGSAIFFHLQRFDGRFSDLHFPYDQRL